MDPLGPEGDLTEPEPAVIVSAGAKRKPVKKAKSEPVVEPEPELIVEPEPELIVEPEPEAVVEPEPELIVEPEPEAVVEPEPDVIVDLTESPSPEQDPSDSPATDDAPVGTQLTDAEASDTGSVEENDSTEVPKVEADEPDDGKIRFTDLGLNDKILEVLTGQGYENPTPIQAEVIPVVLQGKDLVGQASTGTGKTAAFALPILQRLSDGNEHPSPMAIVLVPTRELAMQVAEAFQTYSKNQGIKVLPVFGGTPIGKQLQALRRGVDVVVATPGRALDLIKRRALDLREVEVVVLDEADEMFEMGFAEDIETLLAETSAERQTVLLSATMPSRINGMVKRHLNDPVRIQIKVKKSADGDGPKIRQMAYVVPGSHKTAALGRLIDSESPTAAIVFCRTRDEVDSVAEALNGWGYRAEALHGGMSQEHRDRVMRRLRNKAADLLVATDVAARGLDIDHLSHVINYDVPTAPESYVHRIGRVGRAGREGVALTIVEPRNRRRVSNIERLTKVTMTVAKIPTVKDLNAKRLQKTEADLAALVEANAPQGFDEQGEVSNEAPKNRDAETIVNALMAKHDLMDITLAAIGQLHSTSGRPTDDVNIPDMSSKFDRGGKDRGGKGGRGSGGGEKRQFNGDTASIFIGAGKAAGVRPQDLVGAIAGETHLSGRDIGPIQINERFSTVGVPKESAEQVISIMRNATVKGSKVTVKLDSDGGGGSKGGGYKGKSGGGGYKGKSGGGYKGKKTSKPWDKGSSSKGD